MSAPVPLNSGCCAPPCPSNPQTAVPGPAGENAFSFTTANFTQPVVGGTVTVGLTHDGWVSPGQTVFVQGGGFYQVVSVSGLNVLLDNTGNSGNASPGATILSGAKVSPGGTGGTSGNAYTLTSANFTQPAVNAQVNVAVVNSAWAVVGQYVFVSAGGTYTVFSVPDATHITLTNLGYSGNAAPATLITSPQGVSPAGPQGPAGSGAGVTLNSISPTTTKGDLIADNGANNPLASDVRVGVGTNGQALVANSTQPAGVGYATITPNTAATTGDIAIFSGTSGTPLAVTDSKMLITTDGALQSTPSGGNARGTKAVDLQVDRAANTQVASGNDSVLSGGINNTASAQQATVSGGSTNTASGVNSTVGGGSTNTASQPTATIAGGSNNNASGQQSFIGGGDSNTASNTGATVGGGTGNTASASRSTVAGGTGNLANGLDATCGGGSSNSCAGAGATIAGGTANTTTAAFSTVPGGEQAAAVNWGQMAHASGVFVNAGDAQTSEVIWRATTTDATAGVELFLDGAGASQRAVVPLNTAWAFVVRVIGRSSAGVCAVWETKGGIQNNAATVSLINTNTQAVIVDGTGGTWGLSANLAVTADNTNKSLKVAVTGAAATTIRWVAHARLVEVNF